MRRVRLGNYQVSFPDLLVELNRLALNAILKESVNVLYPLSIDPLESIFRRQVQHNNEIRLDIAADKPV